MQLKSKPARQGSQSVPVDGDAQVARRRALIDDPVSEADRIRFEAALCLDLDAHALPVHTGLNGEEVVKAILKMKVELLGDHWC